MKIFTIIMIFLAVNVFSIGPQIDLNVLTEETITLEKSLTGESFFEFSVDKSIFGIKIIIESEADLDLFLNHETIVDESKKYVVRDGKKKVLSLSRMSAFKLFDGKYYGTIVYDKFEHAVIDGKQSKIIPYTLKIETIDFPKIENIKLNEEKLVKLNKTNEWTKFYKIETRNLSELTISTFNPESDIDLYVFYNKINYDYQLATYKAETFAGTEIININKSSFPKFKNGIFYIMVLDKYSLNSEKNFTIKVTESNKLNITSKGKFKSLSSDQKIEQAVFATASIICSEKVGTGVFVSSQGQIITAAHVIKNSDSSICDKIVVAINEDSKKFPKELFYAKVVFIDENIDLALLEVDRFIYSDMNLSNYTFTYLPIKNGKINFGDTIYALGYPAAGGSSSKNSLRITKGIISGFEKKNGTDYIISDIKVDLGNSGGALLDEAYNLIGIVTEILQSDITSFASIFPISNLPKKWKDKISK